MHIIFFVRNSGTGPSVARFNIQYMRAFVFPLMNTKRDQAVVLCKSCCDGMYSLRLLLCEAQIPAFKLFYHSHKLQRAT